MRAIAIPQPWPAAMWFGLEALPYVPGEIDAGRYAIFATLDFDEDGAAHLAKHRDELGFPHVDFVQSRSLCVHGAIVAVAEISDRRVGPGGSPWTGDLPARLLVGARYLMFPVPCAGKTKIKARVWDVPPRRLSEIAEQVGP